MRRLMCPIVGRKRPASGFSAAWDPVASATCAPLFYLKGATHLSEAPHLSIFIGQKIFIARAAAWVASIVAYC